MNFGLDHYVPALKLKPAEKGALAALAPEIRRHIVPLFQVVQLVEGMTLDARLEKSFSGFKSAVTGLPRYFIDPQELTDELRPKAAAAAAGRVFASCRGFNVAFTPVSGISRDEGVTRAALRENERDGFALRVTQEDFDKDRLKQLPAFLKAHDLSAAETDLIVDLGTAKDVDIEIDFGLMRHFHDWMSSLPLLRDWRTLTLLSSAFPKSLTDLRNDHRPFDRWNWRIWRDYTRRPTQEVPRPPTFGDWGIQFPKAQEPKQGKLNVSGQIRFAQEAQWIINKGVVQDEEDLSSQMPRLAAPFASGELAGPLKAKHCTGCSSILAVASGAQNLALPAAWREIGTIHHITTTVESILSLRES